MIKSWKQNALYTGNNTFQMCVHLLYKLLFLFYFVYVTYSQIILVVTSRNMMAKFGWKICSILDYSNGLIHAELTLFPWLGVSLSETFNLLPYLFSPLISETLRKWKFMVIFLQKINVKIPGVVRTFNKNEKLVWLNGMNERHLKCKIFCSDIPEQECD